MFKTGIDTVSFLPVLKLCSWCFEQPSGDSGTRAPRAEPESSITLYIGERELVCFVYLRHHPRSHFIKLLIRDLFLGLVTVHIISFYVWPFAFMLQVTRIKYIIRSRSFLDFVRSRLTRDHPSEPEMPNAMKYFWKHNSYQNECFLKQWICIEHWIWSPIHWPVPISRIISNQR